MIRLHIPTTVPNVPPKRIETPRQQGKTMKKILYVDMDSVLVDLPSGTARLCEEDRTEFEERYDDCPAIFSLMDAMHGDIESFRKLAEHFDTYILSTAPWLNPASMHKVDWVHKHLQIDKEGPAFKRLILSHHKNLNRGHFLIDDREKNGASEFEGEHILFGSLMFPDLGAVTKYLIPLA